MTRLINAATAVATAALLAVSTASPQSSATTIESSNSETGFLPSAAFAPLVADPGEQQFGAALRHGDFTSRGSLDGIASFGASLPVFGFGKKFVIQIGASGGVIARFDMQTRANDIVSEDYEIGFPVWFRSGKIGGRLRVYHRSSHIGDEFVLNNPDFTRFDLTYEAIEGIVGASLGRARVYLGGDYIYHNATTDIDPGTARVGADITSRPFLDNGSTSGRLIAGVDLEGYRDLDWRVAKSAVAGLELSRARGRQSSMRILVELFDGPSNAGQFYGKSEHYIGLATYIIP